MKFTYFIVFTIAFSKLANARTLPEKINTSTSVVSAQKQEKNRIVLVRPWNEYKILPSLKRKAKACVSKASGVLLTETFAYKIPEHVSISPSCLYRNHFTWYGHGKRGPPSSL